MDQAQVIWMPIAAEQFEYAIVYTADHRGPTYAERTRAKVLEATRKLSSFPKMGAAEPLLSDYPQNYRYWVVWSYKIIYRFDKEQNKIFIVRFFHTSQNPDKLIF